MSTEEKYKALVDAEPGLLKSMGAFTATGGILGSGIGALAGLPSLASAIVSRNPSQLANFARSIGRGGVYGGVAGLGLGTGIVGTTKGLRYLRRNNEDMINERYEGYQKGIKELKKLHKEMGGKGDAPIGDYTHFTTW